MMIPIHPERASVIPNGLNQSYQLTQSLPAPRMGLHRRLTSEESPVGDPEIPR
jgi:hypothetical protein